MCGGWGTGRARGRGTWSLGWRTEGVRCGEAGGGIEDILDGGSHQALGMGTH